MSENVQVEQPQDISKVVSDEGQVSTINDSGSTFGKFKDATSLLSAYNSLEAEFTRKSQKLAETIKELEKSKSAEGLARENDKGSTQEENIKSDSLTENKPSQNETQDNIKNQWKRRVDDFFLKNAEAKVHSAKIAKVLRDNRELISMKNGIDIAFSLVKASELKKPADLINDPDFLSSYVMNNPDIKNSIIRDYLGQTLSSPKAPKVLSGTSSGVYASPNTSKPSSIFDAGQILSKMLNGKK